MSSLKLTTFGGIAPRTRPNNLHQAMAQIAEDVDLSRGTLRPWRTDKKVSPKTGNSIFVDKCCYLASDNCQASFSRIDTDCCFIVASGVKDYPVIQKKAQACNENWQRLGFPVEIPAPNAQFLGTLSDDFNTELRQYYYTLVDSFGFESAPSLPSEPIYAHNDQAVVLSGISTNFRSYNIAKVRLYCAVTPLDYGDPKADYDAHFLLVDELDVGTTNYIHQPHTVSGDYQGAADALLEYNKVRDQKTKQLEFDKGVFNRRKREREMFLGVGKGQAPDIPMPIGNEEHYYHFVPTMPQKNQLPDEWLSSFSFPAEQPTNPLQAFTDGFNQLNGTLNRYYWQESSTTQGE